MNSPILARSAAPRAVQSSAAGVVGETLSDFDADQRLLAWSGVSLVIFTSPGCASCRWAKAQLPTFDLPVDRLCWIDAGDNGGVVERYQVLRLPALFVVRDGLFYGALQSALNAPALHAAVQQALASPADDLP